MEQAIVIPITREPRVTLRSRADARTAAEALRANLRKRVLLATEDRTPLSAYKNLVHDVRKGRAAGEETLLASAVVTVANPKTDDRTVMELVSGLVSDLLAFRPVMHAASWRDDTAKQNKADLAQLDHETAPECDEALERAIEATTTSLLTTQRYLQTLLARRAERRSTILPFPTDRRAQGRA